MSNIEPWIVSVADETITDTGLSIKVARACARNVAQVYVAFAGEPTDKDAASLAATMAAHSGAPAFDGKPIVIAENATSAPFVDLLATNGAMAIYGWDMARLSAVRGRANGDAVSL